MCSASPISVSPARLSAAQVLLCGAAIVTLSMGVRHGFGLWLQPITQDMGWTRENFSFALAIQNLAWGLFGIFAGMAADRFGAFRVLVGGAVLYAAGLAGMALSPTPFVFMLTAGLLIGAAQAGTTYAVVYGVIGRQIPAERRSWAMGVAAAAGSFGQFLMVPVEGWLISGFGWQQALLILGAAVLLIMPLALFLREPGFRGGAAPKREQTIGQALREAFGYRSFQLLMAGYFVCGFQVVFIGVHMPSYLKDHGLSPQVASYALAIIGLFNVIGTYAAGALGQRLAKRHILAFIYLARSVAIVGAGAAGNSAADELRLLGFEGAIALFDRDPEAPYDRPNLSKDYLAGTVQDAQLPLQPSGYYEERRIELVRGRQVTALDPGRKRLTFDDGTGREFDAIVLAPGADPVRLALPGELDPQDAEAGRGVVEHHPLDQARQALARRPRRAQHERLSSLAVLRHGARNLAFAP